MRQTSSLVALLLTAAVVYPTQAHASKEIGQSICNNIKLDNKKRFHKTLRDNRVKLKNIYDGLMCNQKTLLEFAYEQGSNEVGVYMVKRLPSSLLAELSHAGQPITNWAQAKGYGDSPITKALTQKM